MAQSVERVDHTIPKEEAVFAFGPEMKPGSPTPCRAGTAATSTTTFTV